MKVFGKKNNTETRNNPLLEKLLPKVNNKLKGAAAFLQKKTTNYSAGKKKWILFLFCFVFISESVFIIYNSFHGNHSQSYAVTPIRVMPLIKEYDKVQTVQSKELLRVHQFKRYLDSLSFSERGKTIRDSLLMRRPGLMDTLIYLDNIYQETKKETYGKDDFEK